ncbi:hypothetical protein MMC12_001092 [Toensbergia leucococca]|nr:hypothetical protein [Toensbergia leucococca]
MLRLNTHQDSHPDLVSISSRDIAKFILQNPRLRNLSLRLAERSSEGAVSNLHWETLDHALEHVSRSDFQLESLALEGNSHFSKGAWTAWRTNFGWTSLRSLSIANITLAQQMTSHLSGQLPALQTLKLSVFDESDSADLIRISDDTDKFKSASASIKAFISTLHLTGLSLHGFNPDILDHSIESSSVTLRKLRLHVCDSDPSLLFGTEPRENLRSTCKALEWLGLNVTPLSLLGASHISDKPIKIEYIPRGNASAGKVGSHYDPIIADTYLLDTLATILPLRHIRLFIHWPYDDETLPMSNTQAISIFAYLRSHKRGNALESLVICGHEWGTSGVWIIWDLGPWMATLESCKNGQWYEEVWNTEERKLCERRERHVVGPASIKDYFGVPEGW